MGSLPCGTGKLGALVMFCQGTENPAGSHLPRKDIGVHLMSPREDESREQTASPRCHQWPRTAGPDGRVLSAGRGRHVHPAPCPSIRLPGFLYTDKGTRGPPSFPLGWGWGVPQGVNSCRALPRCCDSHFQTLCCGFFFPEPVSPTPWRREGAERQFSFRDSDSQRATHSEYLKNIVDLGPIFMI